MPIKSCGGVNYDSHKSKTLALKNRAIMFPIPSLWQFIFSAG